MNWISVKDRLPSNSADVLVTDGDACMVAWYNEDKRHWVLWDLGFWHSEDVTHWMPLPEPPKE